MVKKLDRKGVVVGNKLNKKMHSIAKMHRLVSSKNSSPIQEVVDTISDESSHSMVEENQLLSSYTSDTVYRLRYDNMNYDYISPAITRLLGFSVEEMKQINFRSLIVETKLVTDGLKVVNSFDELEKHRRDGDINKWQADYLIRTKTGHKIWVSDISYPWFDKEGKIIGSVGSLRDITERVKAEEEMRKEFDKLANVDALTGLHSRNEFFNELDKELKRIDRSDEQVSILLIDLDHFRTINDDYGREIGDVMLTEVTHIIQECLRDTDLPCRLGGEEFGVLLPDTSSNGAFWVAERIREAVMKHNFDIGRDLGVIKCSVSIGVATAIASEDKHSSDLYKIADTRLYIAKHTGRNQVSVDEIFQTH